MTPALPPMPAMPSPLQVSASSSATATAKGGDGAFGGSGSGGVNGGDWNISYGEGDATSSGGVNWLYIGLAAAAVWWIRKRA